MARTSASARYSAGVRSTLRPCCARRAAVVAPTAASLTPPRARRSRGPASSRSKKASTAFALEKTIQSNLPAPATASSSGAAS
jgi:hypothetical protein